MAWLAHSRGCGRAGAEAVAECPGPKPQVLTWALESRKHIVFMDSALALVGPNSAERLLSPISLRLVFVLGAVQEVLAGASCSMKSVRNKLPFVSVYTHTALLTRLVSPKGLGEVQTNTSGLYNFAVGNHTLDSPSPPMLVDTLLPSECVPVARSWLTGSWEDNASMSIQYRAIKTFIIPVPDDLGMILANTWSTKPRGLVCL